MIRPLVLHLAVVLSACGFGYAQKPACPLSDEKQAMTEADTLRTWDVLYKSYTLYQKCDDGATAEGYGESVARVLVDHWNTLSQFAELVKKDPAFLRFVLRHVDATDDEKDLQKIKTEAKTRCPTGLRAICDGLGKEAESALKQSATSP
jgi:hypothetical protein